MPDVRDRIQEALHDYIVRECFNGQAPAGFDAGFDLIESGSIDSLTMMGLVTFIEGRFGIRFGINDLVPQHFGSITALTSYVQGRLGPSG